MQRILILTSFLFCSSLSFGQFDLERSVIYGGNATDEAKDIAINPAKTFMFFGGRSYSTDGDLTANSGGSDFWIMKRNLDGTPIWSKNYGGLSNDDLVSIMPHPDGGVLAFGTTHTNQGAFGTINGLAGGWLMRTNPAGNIIDGKIFGGQITETAIEAFRAFDGDVTMILQAGSTTLNGQTNNGVLDVWVVHTDVNFNILWSNLLGGTDSDVPVALTQDENGNIYIAAQTKSNLNGQNPNHGEFDAWIMKLNPDGQVAWQKTFGGTDDDIPNDIIVHPDGFVYVTVQSLSADEDFDVNSGINDLWLLKLNETNGNLIDKRRYGGTGNEFNGKLEFNKENDHVLIAVTTTSTNGDLTGNKGLSDVWIIETDLDGNITQQMNYGGSINDLSADILTVDTVFHVLNSTFSNDKNVPFNTFAQQDMWYFTLNTNPGPCSDQFVCLSDTTPTNILYPPDNNALVCVSGCTAGLGAGPNFLNSPCADFNDPTAYFKVVTDTMSDLLTLSVTSNELNKPRIAVFKTINCTTYQQVLCATGHDGSVLMQYLEVQPRTTYVIAISDDEANIGGFEFCASSIHVEFCNIEDQIYVTNTSMGSPPLGPYKPGEEVTFCYELQDWEKLDCNGFQGLIPTFGPGWDSTSFNLFGEPIQVDSMIAPINTGFWQWYSLGDVHYNISNPINGFDGGQGMPAGWYFTNTGDPPPTTEPDETTGDIETCLNTNDRWKVCFTVRVVDECESNLDCSITMKTYADGEIGNKSSLACVYDQAEVFNAIMRCCINPGIANIQDFSICSGDTISLKPGTNLNPPVTYTWTATPDPFITGATTGFQLDSFYQILKNTVVIPQKVKYSIRAQSEGCATQAEDFDVTVYPKPTGQLSLVGPNTVCSGSTVSLHFQLFGDAPFAIGLYRDNTFFANVLSENNTITINVDPIFSSVLTIGTLRDANCDGTGSGSVLVNISPASSYLIDTVLCVGETLIVGDTVLADPGTYEIVLDNEAASGCDSIINVTLAVIPSLNENQSYVICQGDTVWILGEPYTETTNEIIEYLGPEGCPNYIHLDLVVKDTFSTEISQTICFGDTLDFEGIKVFEEGTYSHTEEVRPGCFEQTILHLDVLPAIVINDLSIMADDGHGNGAIIVEIVGGKPPFTFLLYTNQTSESIFNIPSGHYAQTVTDANGCQEIFQYEVPFVSATHDLSKTLLSCRPTLLHQGEKIRLINTGKEEIQIAKLELTATTGQSLLVQDKIQVPGESYYYSDLPASLAPGIYFLTAWTKDRHLNQWKIVIE